MIREMLAMDSVLLGIILFLAGMGTQFVLVVLFWGIARAMEWDRIGRIKRSIRKMQNEN